MLHADEIYDLTPEDELPLKESTLHELGYDDIADRDSGDPKGAVVEAAYIPPLPTEYGEQAAECLIGEEFDDLLDLLNGASENARWAALRHIKALAGIYTELVATATTQGALPPNANLR